MYVYKPAVIVEIATKSWNNKLLIIRADCNSLRSRITALIKLCRFFFAADIMSDAESDVTGRIRFYYFRLLQSGDFGRYCVS